MSSAMWCTIVKLTSLQCNIVMLIVDWTIVYYCIVNCTLVHSSIIVVLTPLKLTIVPFTFFCVLPFVVIVIVIVIVFVVPTFLISLVSERFGFSVSFHVWRSSHPEMLAHLKRWNLSIVLPWPFWRSKVEKRDRYKKADDELLVTKKTHKTHTHCCCCFKWLISQPPLQC